MKRAHRPYMILGTAANNSITKERGVAKREGDISDMNIAIPKLMGTPIAIAIAALIRVPTTYGNAPKDSRPSTAFQSVPVRNPNPSNEKISQEPSIIAYPTRATMSKVYPAAAMTIVLKILSLLRFPEVRLSVRTCLFLDAKSAIIQTPNVVYMYNEDLL
jgi:hypothetical protein